MEPQAEASYPADAEAVHNPRVAGSGDWREGPAISAAVLEERRKLDEARSAAAAWVGGQVGDKADAGADGLSSDGGDSSGSCDSLLGTAVTVRVGGYGGWHGRVSAYGPVDDSFEVVDEVGGEAAYFLRDELVPILEPPARRAARQFAPGGLGRNGAPCPSVGGGSDSGSLAAG